GFVAAAHRWPPPATAGEAGQQGGSLPWDATRPPRVATRIVGEPRLIRHELLPTDVGWVHVATQRRPALRCAMEPPWCPARLAFKAGTAAPIGEGARVGGIAQDGVQGCRRWLLPQEWSGQCPGGLGAGQEEAIITEAAQHFLAGPQGGEVGKH